MTYSKFRANLNNWKVPTYVQDVIACMPDATGIKFDSTCKFRYIIFSDSCEVRVSEKHGVLLPRKPTNVQLKYTRRLPQPELCKALTELYNTISEASNVQ